MIAFKILWLEADHSIGFWSIIILFLPLIIRLAWDGHRILVERKEVKHGKHSTATAFFIFIAALAVWCLEPVKTIFQPFLLSWGIFWMFFDYALNLIRGERIFYIDLGLDGKRSFFDSVYERIGVHGTLFAKVWFLLLGISLYFNWSYFIGERTPW